MSDDSGTTIKYGRDFDAPWSTPKGTVEERRQALADEFGLEARDKTLAELTVEAAIHAQSLYAAIKGLGQEPDYTSTARALTGQDSTVPEDPSKGAEPERDSKPAETPPVKKGVAAKKKASAKTEEAEVAEPPELSLELKIRSARTADDIDTVFKFNKTEWLADKDKYTPIAKARREELSN